MLALGKQKSRAHKNKKYEQVRSPNENGVVSERTHLRRIPLFEISLSSFKFKNVHNLTSQKLLPKKNKKRYSNKYLKDKLNT
ncbi:MAG: hypothetical protein NZM26_04730 [Patescibacteria group bacterium]|nr:hypothetical protein [Patescibacteria group bacterium]